MKFLHVSDLHLGKRLHETSLIEDQKAILEQIIAIADEEKPFGVLIAGDVYDRSTPGADAVSLFDYFLVELAKRDLQVFIISGNHDSAERIAFGSKIMDSAGIHLSPVYDGEIKPTTLVDEYGDVNVFMLPFVKPPHVRRFFADEEIESYTDALGVAVRKMNIDKTKRNILVTHQYVTGATRSDSEESVGGTDNVDASVFEDFDYVALGHLHCAQFCDVEKIRYSGTPLKYSFSEADDLKSVTVLTLGRKGEPIKIEERELTPLRDLRKIRGKFEDLMTSAERSDDYVQITLTDEDDVPNAMSRLQTIYQNALDLRYDNTRTRSEVTILSDDGVERKTTLELFSEFFADRNNQEMSDVQRDYVKNLIERLEEDGE